MYFFPISCSQRKIRTPKHRLKLERWTGPPHINKVKQNETVLSFKVSLFIQSFKTSLIITLHTPKCSLRDGEQTEQQTTKTTRDTRGKKEIPRRSTVRFQLQNQHFVGGREGNRHSSAVWPYVYIYPASWASENYRKSACESARRQTYSSHWPQWLQLFLPTDSVKWVTCRSLCTWVNECLWCVSPAYIHADYHACTQSDDSLIYIYI